MDPNMMAPLLSRLPMQPGSTQQSPSPGGGFKTEDDESLSPMSNAQGQQAIKRRAPIACRRCRRMRSKCVHDKAKPPCKSCSAAGLGPGDCIFPVRGQPDNDRDYRHPRARSEKSSRRDPTKTRRDTADAGAPVPRALGPPEIRPEDEWELLPPLPEVVEGVKTFTRHYFQLGFIPKQQFPLRLHQAPGDANVFLLLSILSISARFTPALAERYGSGMKAAEMFMDRAARLACSKLYQPSLEICQAFYLLSIAQQGDAMKNPSYINMGIAIRMAALMQLHREETYCLRDPSRDDLMRAESARRTLWMLHSQDNLHSGPRSPVSLPASDITALLPGSESDFENGTAPEFRAALPDTPPALRDPHLVYSSRRSLFASLIQVHYYWGDIARRAVDSRAGRHKKDELPPWDEDSQYSVMERQLYKWEHSLPNDHKWSLVLLRGYKADRQDLAYLGVTMMTRLCQMVVRREFLDDIIKGHPNDPNRERFFADMSLQLFQNVRELYEQIHAQFADRTRDESVGAQMAAFCVYSCGLFSTYLVKYPRICPDPEISRMGPIMLRRTIDILTECKEVWPLATRWLRSLEKYDRDPKSTSIRFEGGMADGHDPVPVALPGAKSLLECTLPSPSINRLPHPDEKKRIFPSTPTGTPTPAPVLPPPTSSMLNPVAPGGFPSPNSQSQYSSHHGYAPPPPPAPSNHAPPTHHEYSYGPPPPSSQPSPYQSRHQPRSSHPPYHEQRSRTLLIETNFHHPVTPQSSAASAVTTAGAAVATSDMLYDPSGAYYSPAATTLGPGTDGYEEQLQFYIDGQTDTSDGPWTAGPSLYGF